MKIGLVAVSGIRVLDSELVELGLTMPGIVRRGTLIASLPSLSLLTLAALTPADVEVEYREWPGDPEEFEPPGDWDLVAISTFTAKAFDAYALADRCRAQGLPVVIGGLHVTACPEEASEHATSVVVGEGELLWPTVVEDLRAGNLQPIYRSPNGVRFRLADAPVPRFDLLEIEQYNRITVQTTRGCPHRCDFCAASPLLVPGWSMKPAHLVIEEIRRVRELWPRPFIEFADDNSFPYPRRAHDLLRALREERIRWFTETDLAVADDPALLDLLRESGCRQLLIGLESPTAAGLDGVEMRRNWKLGRLAGCAAAIEAIQSRGITVNGTFALGLDGDTEEVFDAVADFVEESGLFEVQITVLTPFPGTPLYDRLRREGRLLEEGAWDRCTLFDVNHMPLGMSPERLRQGLRDLTPRLYSPDAVSTRQERFFHEMRRRGLPGAERQQEEWYHDSVMD
jgi:radical SAM superfamily enzyme YgiQ (UPF0313 family)